MTLPIVLDDLSPVERIPQASDDGSDLTPGHDGGGRGERRLKKLRNEVST